MGRLSKAIYTSPRFTWLSYIVGGLLFGWHDPRLGLRLEDADPHRQRATSSRSSSRYVLAITAYMTLKEFSRVSRGGARFRGSDFMPAAGSAFAPRSAFGHREEDRPRRVSASRIAAGLAAFVFKAGEFRLFDNGGSAARRGWWWLAPGICPDT